LFMQLLIAAAAAHIAAPGKVLRWTHCLPQHANLVTGRQGSGFLCFCMEKVGLVGCCLSFGKGCICSTPSRWYMLYWTHCNIFLMHAAVRPQPEKCYTTHTQNTNYNNTCHTGCLQRNMFVILAVVPTQAPCSPMLSWHARLYFSCSC